jgi:hypothetical protein
LGPGFQVRASPVEDGVWVWGKLFGNPACWFCWLGRELLAQLGQGGADGIKGHGPAVGFYEEGGEGSLQKLFDRR